MHLNIIWKVDIQHKPSGFFVGGGHNSLLNPHLGRSFGGVVPPLTQILVIFFRNTSLGYPFLDSLPEALVYVIWKSATSTNTAE